MPPKSFGPPRALDAGVSTVRLERGRPRYALYFAPAPEAPLFHMTLSGPVGEGAGELAHVLDRAFRDAVPAGPARVDRIAVFRQETPKDRFRVQASVKLAG